jgi:hypothetical protein
MYTTTPQDFLKALPGELKITAIFPEATVEITQFENVKKAAEGCVERTLLSAASDSDFFDLIIWAALDFGWRSG